MNRRSTRRPRRARLAFDRPETLETRALLSNVPVGSFNASTPAGTWGYEARPAEAISSPGEVDTIAFSVDRGQTLSIGLTGAPDLRARVELIAVDQGNAVVASASAAGPGQPVLLPVVTAPGVATSSAAPLSYSVRVTGLDGTVGTYTTRISLNAALEAETFGGTPDNSLAQAQNLDGLFIGPLKANEGKTPTVQPLRAAVLGTTDAIPLTPEVEGNQPPDLIFPEFDPYAVAQPLDGGRWSLDEVENIDRSTELRHVSVTGTGDGTYDYYRVEIPDTSDLDAYSEIWVDIDEANFDSEILVYLYDGFGSFLYGVNDVLSFDSGDVIESAVFGTFLQGYPSVSLIFVIGRQFSNIYPTGQPFGAPLEAEDSYTLHVSITKHAANEEAADPIIEVEPNHPTGEPPTPYPLLPYAQDLEDSTWFQAPDANVPLSETIPYVSISATGDDTYDYYKFVVPTAGAQAVFDLDFGSFDGTLHLFDSEGNVLAFSDDDGGDPGSPSILDPMILYTFDEPGTYVIAVAGLPSDGFFGQLFGVPVPAGTSYTLHVGVEGHSAIGFDASDLYKVTLRAGDRFSAVAGAPAGVDLELLDAEGNVLTSGETVSASFGDAILDWPVPTSGVYYARVRGAVGRTPYSLVAIRNATLDAEGNNSIATAQPVLGPATNAAVWAFGSIGRRDLVINAFDSGWYDESGFHNPTNTNYCAGWLPPSQFPPPDGELRDFFAFNVPVFSEAVLGARFRVTNPSSGYLSGDPTETFSLYDVSTPIGQLVAGGSGLTGTFDDLGTGVTYATRTFSAADNGRNIEIGLNPAILGDLQARQGGQFALGGALSTINPEGPLQRVFGFTSASLARQLLLSLTESDFYQITIPAGTGTTIETLTPGGAGGDFSNSLDPLIRLYDASGTLVASNDNGAADGRNAQIKFAAPPSAGGTYFVEVTFAPVIGAVTSGEYVLKMFNVGAASVETRALASKGAATDVGPILPFDPATVDHLIGLDSEANGSEATTGLHQKRPARPRI